MPALSRILTLMPALSRILSLTLNPHQVAASAICLARVTLDVRPYWTPELQDLSAYDASAVRACIVELHSLHRKACSAQLRAVFDKYATPDRLAVSSLTPPETLPLVLDNAAF